MPLILTLRDHLVLLASGRPGSDDSTSYSSLVSGLHTAPAFIIQNGSAATLTIELSLAGVRYLLGLPASTLARSSVPAASVLGPSVEALKERVELAESWGTALALVDEYLLSQLPDHPIEHGLVDAAWRMIRSGIAAECGYYDEAHLIREWNSFTGTTPTSWRTDDETAFHQSHEDD